jgi:hypothetical protein
LVIAYLSYPVFAYRNLTLPVFHHQGTKTPRLFATILRTNDSLFSSPHAAGNRETVLSFREAPIKLGALEPWWLFLILGQQFFI